MQMEQMPDYENDKDVLQKFGRNINEEVKKGKIDPVIGRDEEIRKIYERGCMMEEDGGSEIYFVYEDGVVTYWRGEFCDRSIIYP